MLTVHHLENSRSQRVLWLLEELEVPYQLKVYQRDRKTSLAPPELKQIHPLGKAPIVIDGDEVLVESGAILEYLVETYGQGRLAPAPGTPERQRYTFWMHYAEGSAMPPLLLLLITNRIRSAKVPFFVRPITKGIAQKLTDGFVGPQVKTHLDFVEAELARGQWFVGDMLTAADIQMSFPLEAATARAPGMDSRPHIRAFVERIRARPAYQRALAKGGPYTLGL